MANLVYYPGCCKSDSEQRVVLNEREKWERKDSIGIALDDSYMTDLLTLTRDGDKILLSGHTELLDKDNLKGIIGKNEDLLPTVDKDTIISRCDEWMKAFKKVLKHLINITANSKYKPEVCLTNLGDEGSVTHRGIFAGVYDELGELVIDGIEIQIPVENSNVYTYLVASVFGYALTDVLGVMFDPSTIDLGKPINIRFNLVDIYLEPDKDDILTSSVISQMYQMNNNIDSRDPKKDIKNYLKNYRSLITDQRMNIESLDEEVSYAVYDMDKVLSFKPSKK